MSQASTNSRIPKSQHPVEDDEFRFLDIVLNEYIDLPQVRFLLFKNNREQKIQIAIEQLQTPYIAQRRTTLIPLRILRQARKNLDQSDALYELQCLEFNQELAQSTNTEPNLQDALAKEHSQNKMFSQVHRNSIKNINQQLLLMK